MSSAAPALLRHGVSGRAIPPFHQRDCRFLPGACSPSKSLVLGSSSASLVCCASLNNNRSRNSDIAQQQKRGSSRGKSKLYQERNDSESIDEFEGDITFSKRGASNSRPQAASTPGQREKEIVDLFRRVQEQLRMRGKGREDKKSEPTKTQGERGSVDSLLNLLRKHSVDQRKKSSDENETNSDHTGRGNDSESKQSTRVFGIKNDIQEEQRPPPAYFRRPPSNFKRKSPVPGVKFQPVTNDDAAADAKSIIASMSGAELISETPQDKKPAPDQPDSVSPYEPDFIIPPENISLDDFGGAPDDDESDALRTDEPDEEYLGHSVEISDVTDSNVSHAESLECSSAEGPDLSSLKVTELRELAKSRGIKGYSKMKKNDLVELLINMA